MYFIRIYTSRKKRLKPYFFFFINISAAINKIGWKNETYGYLEKNLSVTRIQVLPNVNKLYQYFFFFKLRFYKIWSKNNAITL